jgi:hypothetical protein
MVFFTMLMVVFYGFQTKSKKSADQKDSSATVTTTGEDYLWWILFIVLSKWTLYNHTIMI